MTSNLSRLLPVKTNKSNDVNAKPWREEIDGRIVLNLWGILRHEVWDLV